jgi:long-chain fatty acid adenylyltransferase FadD28
MNAFSPVIILPGGVDPTPQGPWLRTGDLGFSDGELFIKGRIKDLLIVYGRNHAPEDIEATIQKFTGGRCVAIAVPDDHTEKLVVIVELKKRGGSHDDVMDKLGSVSSSVKSPLGLRMVGRLETESAGQHKVFR